MAIKYLAGNRIQGTNTDRVALSIGDSTFSDTMDSSSGWTTVGSGISITGGKLTGTDVTLNGENRIHKAIGTTLSDTAWVLQAKLTIEAPNNNNGYFYPIVISNGNGDFNQATSVDMIFFLVDSSNVTGYFRSQDGTTQTNVGTGTTHATTFWIDIIRDGSTMTMKGYTSEANQTSGTTSFNVNFTISGTVSGLDTIQSGASSFNTATQSWSIDWIKVYNGVTTVPTITPYLESNSIFEESDTGEHYLRVKYGWFKFGDTGSMPNYRGIFTGGYNSTAIDYITIATTGNGTDFGDLATTGKAGAGVSNGTLGILGGDDNVLNQVTIATTANSTDFGDLTGIGGNATACADATRGVWTRGNINYITMASASNATDWGHDRSPNAGDPCAFADTTRGIISGGEAYISGWVDINDMDYITIQTISSATDFGDLTDGKRQLSGVANDTYGFAIAGYDGSSYLNNIDYVTIQTLGNASDFGNLTQSRVAQNSACGDATRAILGGGHTGSDVNTIDYFTMGTSGNASDFGDLTSARTRVMSCSDYVK